MNAKKLQAFFDRIIPVISQSSEQIEVRAAAENALRDAVAAHSACMRIAAQKSPLPFDEGDAKELVRIAFASADALGDTYDSVLTGYTSEASYHVQRGAVAAGKSMMREAREIQKSSVSAEIFRAQMDLWGRAPISAHQMLSED